MDIGSDIIKLEGYGVYVSIFDDAVYTSPIRPRTNGPAKDPDGCIIWDKLADPPNLAFLMIINKKFGTNFTMTDFGRYPSIGEILWAHKNRKEKEK